MKHNFMNEKNSQQKNTVEGSASLSFTLPEIISSREKVAEPNISVSNQ